MARNTDLELRIGIRRSRLPANVLADVNDLPMLRTGERYSFRRCPQQWYWRYRMGLTPKKGPADALWFGIGVHYALAEWYQKGKRRGPHPADTFAEWCGDEIRYLRTVYSGKDAEWFDEPKYEDAQELGVAMLDAYTARYGRDSKWNVLAIEQPFNIIVKNKGVPIVDFGSRFDGVVRDEEDGYIYLLEHKTAAQIQTAYLELDDQAGAYWAVATNVLRAQKVIKQNEFLHGIIYNFLRKVKPDPRPQNEGGAYLNMDGQVSKKQPAPAFVRHIVEREPVEQRTQLIRLSNEVAIMQAVKSGSLPIIKNTTRECSYCEFFTMCKLHERGSEAWREVAKADFVQKDPYEDQRKSA